MTPRFLKVSPNPDHSFSVRHDVVPFFLNRWHYHQELELIYIVKGSGTQFVGDDIRRFKSGDIILIGSNLPHFWQCDEPYFEPGSTMRAEAIVTHFSENFWGNEFLDLAENKKIKDLFSKAKRGLAITGAIRPWVETKLRELLSAAGTERIIILLQILHRIADQNTVKLISENGFIPTGEARDAERINAIYNYSIANFRKKISLPEIARHANISPNSFCRYFKAHTRKTYNVFLQELRVGHARKLLVENRKTITHVCYESGFNNAANFYKAFRRITGKTPCEYQRTFLARQD